MSQTERDPNYEYTFIAQQGGERVVMQVPSEVTIGELTRHLRAFLLAAGFAQENVDEYVPDIAR